MGTDIHPYIEYLEYPAKDGRPDQWACFAGDGCGDLGIWRNYSLFGVLSGLRDSDALCAVEPRGLPPNLSWPARQRLVEDGGYHTPSWLTLDELRRARADYIAHVTAKYREETPPEKSPIDPSIAAMEALERMGWKTRFVFAFDS